MSGRGFFLEKKCAFFYAKLQPFQVLSITGEKHSPILFPHMSVFLANFSHQGSGLLGSPL